MGSTISSPCKKNEAVIEHPRNPKRRRSSRVNNDSMAAQQSKMHNPCSIAALVEGVSRSRSRMPGERWGV